MLARNPRPGTRDPRPGVLCVVSENDRLSTLPESDPNRLTTDQAKVAQPKQTPAIVSCGTWIGGQWIRVPNDPDDSKVASAATADTYADAQIIATLVQRGWSAWTATIRPRSSGSSERTARPTRPLCADDPQVDWIFIYDADREDSGGEVVYCLGELTP
jgi:hypothetical protein